MHRTLAELSDRELSESRDRLARLEARAADLDWQNHRKHHAAVRAEVEAELKRRRASG
jgi:hypothetical protein